MKSFALLASLPVLLALGPGCVLVNVDIHPTEQADLPHAPNAGRGREVIVVVPFAEKRYEPSRCGMQKNGYNMDTADAICTIAPNRWLGDALAQALVKSGYRVLTADAVPGPSTVVIKGELRQFFVEPKVSFLTFSFEADIGILLDVSSPSGLHARRHFYVKGKEHDHMSMEIESRFQTSADEAAGKIIGSMVVAITELLNQYPDLGAPSATVRVAQGPR